MTPERTEHGFRVGPVEVMLATMVGDRPVVTVRVGDCEVDIAGTPKGNRAYVTVTERGRTRVSASVYADGRWWQPGKER